MAFPGPQGAFPTKDETADYLEAYAARFDLPVELGARVDRLSRDGERFTVSAGDRRYEADNVVVAMATFQVPSVPRFASQLDRDVVQMHSSAYCNPSQLQDGGVLIVGAGNSGAEIGLDVVGRHQTWVSGRGVGHVPFRIETPLGRNLLVPFVLRFLYHRVMTIDTPMGRRMRPKVLSHGGPLVRVKPGDLSDAGVERVPRTAGVREGLPVVGDGRLLDVANVIWATGYRPGFSWIDLPIFADENGSMEPKHVRGIVPDMPGLYFVGLFFLYAMSSGLLGGVGRDAEYVVRHLASRVDNGSKAS
jgi:putative flavoprotein involved in K+ transport